MKYIKIVIAVVALCFGANLITLSAKPKNKKVYVFGISASFTDSLVYVTDIQCIDSAFVESGSGLLYGRHLYTNQYENFMVNNLQRKNTTCALFFDESKAKAEKRYMAFRKDYEANKALLVRYIQSNEFAFTAPSLDFSNSDDKDLK